MSHIPEFSSALAYQNFIQQEADLRKADAERKAFDNGFARIIHDRLMTQIVNFQKKIKKNEEVAACLASFGTSVIIRIVGVEYHDPYTLIFHGENDDGSPMRLVQHVSQLNVLLTAAKVPEDREPRRLGFDTIRRG